MDAADLIRVHFEDHYGSVENVLAAESPRGGFKAAGLFYVVMENVEDALNMMNGHGDSTQTVAGVDILVRTFTRSMG
jgi:hypothetical protein